MLMRLANIHLNKEDFDQCGWQEVIASCDKKECLHYYELLFSKAREEEASGNRKSQEVFVLLGSIASLLPNLDSKEEPFRPFAVLYSGSRSASLDDLSDSHLETLKEIVPH